VNFITEKSKKTEVSNKEDDKAIENDRKYILDSVIVRIAKGRKQIKHQELITEVIRQVDHFRPQPPMIKGQIESLIQREFLARDEKDKTLYGDSIKAFTFTWTKEQFDRTGFFSDLTKVPEGMDPEELEDNKPENAPDEEEFDPRA
jgi:Cullin, a subunit of E3 ubiquitin ligase